MQPFERYDSEHPLYPRLLTRLAHPPTFTATGPLAAVRAIAIVGSREPVHDAAVFARSLAFDLASAGVTVVSGGAKGIDAAAHRGALDAGGATWVVCPTGKDRIAPEEHRELFDSVARSPSGRLIWPFADDAPASPETYRARNAILVALSEAVVVIQARLASGSRNACTWARTLGKSLWVAAAPPWGHWEHSFNGSADVLLRDREAHALGSRAQLFEALGLARQAAPQARKTTRSPPLPASFAVSFSTSGARSGPLVGTA